MRRRNAIPRNEKQAHAKERALAALALMRRKKGLSVSAAAKAEHTSLGTIKRYAGSALRQHCPGGHCRISAYDRIARTLNFLTPQGPVAITVRDSKIASQIGEHANAVRTQRNTGDLSALKRFKGKFVRADGVTYNFITDPEILDKLAC
jgi:hypothetical protein